MYGIYHTVKVFIILELFKTFSNANLCMAHMVFAPITHCVIEKIFMFVRRRLMLQCNDDCAFSCCLYLHAFLGI